MARTGPAVSRRTGKPYRTKRLSQTADRHFAFDRRTGDNAAQTPKKCPADCQQGI